MGHRAESLLEIFIRLFAERLLAQSLRQVMARRAKLRGVDSFNKHRLFGPIGYVPPAEAEADYYTAFETLGMVLSLKPNLLRENRNDHIRLNFGLRQILSVNV